MKHLDMLHQMLNHKNGEIFERENTKRTIEDRLIDRRCLELRQKIH